MPAKPKARKRKVRVGIKAKRAAITRAYGRYNPCGDEDFFYSRRHLTKTRPDKNGLRELKYQAEACDLQEAMEETFQRIRDRDGVKYFTEAADGLLREIAFEINYHAGPKAMHREMAKLDNDYPPPYPRGEAAMRRPGRAAARIQNSVSIARGPLKGEIEATAHHEAGHAVIALAAGEAVEVATIKPRADLLGQVRYGRGLADDEPWLIIVFAGPLAQRRFSRRSDWRNAELDEVKKKVSRMHGNGTVAQKYLAYLEARAAKVVDDLWIDIKAVAKALLERETLTGREIRTVIRNAQRKRRTS